MYIPIPWGTTSNHIFNWIVTLDCITNCCINRIINQAQRVKQSKTQLSSWWWCSNKAKAFSKLERTFSSGIPNTGGAAPQQWPLTRTRMLVNSHSNIPVTKSDRNKAKVGRCEGEKLVWFCVTRFLVSDLIFQELVVRKLAHGCHYALEKLNLKMYYCHKERWMDENTK